VRYKAGHEDAVEPIAERVTQTLKADRSVSVPLTSAEIRRLIASGDVESIEENVLCSYYRDTSQASFGITKGRTDFGLTGHLNSDPSTYSSRDVVIAVIDSGIDGNHPDFGNGKIIAWKDFLSNRAQPYDDASHGTHVASIAAGAVNTVGGVMTGGVAPGAALIGLRVGSAAGVSTDRGVAAIDWCVQNKDTYGIRIINISWGPSLTSDGTDAIGRAVDRASAAGLLVVAAAGNAGPWTYTVGGAAAARTALAVGGMHDLGSSSVSAKNGFVLASFSSRGPTADGRVKPDVVAPGVSILAANANRGTYVRNSGTSFSAPFVSGLAALILQANSKLTPAEVIDLLKSTAIHFGPGTGANNDFGAGRVDGYAALLKASGKTGTAQVGPKHTYSAGSIADRTSAGVQIPIQITDTQFPIAATLLLDAPDSRVVFALFDPSGNLVALQDEYPEYAFFRQQTLRYRPRVTGRYTLYIQSLNLPTRYTLDISAGSN
jgi:serine protease AprX